MNGPAGRKRKTQHTKKDAMKFVAKILTIAAALSSLSMGANQVTVDSSIKPYAPTSGVSGNLNAVGSDTLNNLMTLWAEGFNKKYPSVKVGVEGKGSSTAPPALTAGTAQLAPMSRQMKREEIAAFEAKYGYKPTEIKVALDAVAFFAMNGILSDLRMDQDSPPSPYPSADRLHFLLHFQARRLQHHRLGRCGSALHERKSHLHLRQKQRLRHERVREGNSPEKRGL